MSNINQKEIVKLAIVIVFLNAAFFPMMLSVNNPTLKNEPIPKSSVSRTTHSPICIYSDDDFAGFPGTGTLEDPYRIENYEIINEAS